MVSSRGRRPRGWGRHQIDPVRVGVVFGSLSPMAQTLTKLLVHCIFSTKDRADLIPPEIEERLYAYIGGVCRGAESDLIGAGGTANHVHLLIKMSKNVALSDLMMDVKKRSSKWIKTAAPGLGRFGWQDGYAGLTVGQSQVAALHRYLARQKRHHAKTTFKQELLEFLEKYEVEYDARYIWD